MEAAVKPQTKTVQKNNSLKFASGFADIPFE